MGVETRVRSDNAIDVDQVRPINALTNGRKLNSFLHTNWGWVKLNGLLSPAHIPGTISVADELTKSTSQTKLITLLSTNHPRAISEEGNDVLTEIYPGDKQYLSPPKTKKDRMALNTFTRRREGAHSRQMLEEVPRISN